MGPTAEARRSAIVGAVLGTAIAAMGAVIVAIAGGYIDVPDASIHVPRAVLAGVGIGLGLCGGGFAAALLGRRVAVALVMPGLVLAYAVPIAWIAFGPSQVQCAWRISIAGLSIAGSDVPEGSCRTAFGIAALVAAIAAVVAVAVVARWRARRRSTRA